MNIFNYAFRYWLTLMDVGYEENYWDQVFLNDLYAALLDAQFKDVQE